MIWSSKVVGLLFSFCFEKAPSAESGENCERSERKIGENRAWGKKLFLSFLACLLCTIVWICTTRKFLREHRENGLRTIFGMPISWEKGCSEPGNEIDRSKLSRKRSHFSLFWYRIDVGGEGEGKNCIEVKVSRRNGFVRFSRAIKSPLFYFLFPFFVRKNPKNFTNCTAVRKRLLSS